MRAIIVLLTLSTLGSSCLAQGDTTLLLSKRGRPILPQAGDFAIGVDASPFFQYLGNMFNNTVNNPPPSFRSPQFPTLVGKFMKSATTALRVRVAVNSFSQEGKNSVPSTAPAITVTDTKSYSSTNILLGGGIEKRRGKGRLQGIYGVEGFVGFLTNSSNYTYGNQFTTGPVSFTVWNPNSAIAQSVTFGNTRPLETSSGTSMSFGATGFVGVEYFIAPKISMGAEFGYSISYASAGAGTQRTESYTGSLVVTTSDFSPIPSTFSIGTVAAGNIFLNMYF